MKKILLLIIVSLLLGCNSNLEKIDGKWRCDQVATASLEDDGMRAKIMSNELSKGIFINLLSTIALQVDEQSKRAILYWLGQQIPIDLAGASESGDTITITLNEHPIDLTLKGSDTLILSGMPGGPEGLKTIAFKRVSE